MKFIKLTTALLVGWAGISYSAPTYFLITHGSQDPYWTTLFEGAKTAANDLHVNLQILAPAGANDISKQLQYFESASATHPLGIATTLPSELAFSQSLQRAKANHIPVIAFDTQPKDHQKNPYLAYIGSDNDTLGRIAASHALADGYVRNRIVILNPQPGHKGLEARANGIKNILSAKNITIDELDVGIDANTIQAHIKSYFVKHPDTSVVFCLTSQALDPLGEMILHRDIANFKSSPAIYSFDMTPNTKRLVQMGIVKFAPDQQPFLIGYQSIAELVLYNRNQLLPVNINTVTG